MRHTRIDFEGLSTQSQKAHAVIKKIKPLYRVKDQKMQPYFNLAFTFFRLNVLDAVSSPETIQAAIDKKDAIRYLNGPMIWEQRAGIDVDYLRRVFKGVGLNFLPPKH